MTSAVRAARRRRSAGPFHSLRRRIGVTMLEVLVAIGVMALLASLAIPAVMFARSSAVRVRCSGRLKAIGLALNAYEAAHGCYPTAQSDVGPKGISLHSPFVRLLPFLEQSELYDRLNVEQSHAGMFFENAWAKTTAPEFLCPGDRPAQGPDINFRVSLGVSPYAFMKEGNANYPESVTGAFAPMFWYKRTDFVDGLSQTAGVAEKVRGDADDNRYSWPGDFLRSRFNTAPYPSSNILIEHCSALNPESTQHHSTGGSSWYLRGFEFTYYNHLATPNDRQVPDCSIWYRGAPTAPSGGGVFSASSLHSGGVNVLFMDGSLRFISESIALDVWRAIGTRKGGETVSL